MQVKDQTIRRGLVQKGWGRLTDCSQVGDRSFSAQCRNESDGAMAKAKNIKGITHEQRYFLCLQKQRCPGMKQAELAVWFEDKFAISISQPTISHSLKHSVMILSQGLDTPGIEAKRVRKRPVRHPELEQRIFEWVKAQQETIEQQRTRLERVSGSVELKDQVEPITGPSIIREAKRIAKEMNSVSTVFGSAWLSRFKTRYRIQPVPRSQHHPQHLCIVPTPQSSHSDASIESERASLPADLTKGFRVQPSSCNIYPSPQNGSMSANPHRPNRSWIQRKPNVLPQQPCDLNSAQQGLSETTESILCSSAIVSLEPSSFQIPASAMQFHYHPSIPIAAFPLEDSTFKPIITPICPSSPPPASVVCGESPLLSRLVLNDSIERSGSPPQERAAVLIPANCIDEDGNRDPPRDIQDARRLLSQLRAYVATCLANPSRAIQSLDVLEGEIDPSYSSELKQI